MSQVQLTVDFTITGQPQPLAVNPSQDNVTGTVGTALDGTAVAQVTGGTAPYNYALDVASDPMPDGVSFAEDGNGNISLTGTPTTAGTANVILDITDSAGVTAQLKTKIGNAKKKIG